MAAPLNRTWYDSLIDDDGSGTVGTVWNKAQVDGLLDSVDASLAGLVDKTGTPAANALATFVDADTIAAGSGLLATNGNLLRATVAGTDNAATFISGAGASDLTRGAHLYLAGNQFGAPGFVVLQMGNAPGAAISLNRASGAVIQIDQGGLVKLLDGQLQFPATQKPSADVTTLDDYREGTWTPTITGGGGGSGQVYAVQYGEYTKLGKRVFFSLQIRLSSKGTISGPNVYIGGFPFAHDTTGTGSNFLASATVGGFGGLSGNVASLAAMFFQGTNLMLTYVPAAGAVASSSIDPSQITNTSEFYVSGHYRTAN